MEFGINVAPAADSWKIVRRAEEIGFDHAWFIDSPLINAELFVSMAAAAMKTDRIRLGTGVLIPSNRLAPVTASALASLNALAPGRLDFGVGTGFTGRRTLGLGPMKLQAMFDYVDQVCALLSGGIADVEVEGALRPTGFTNPELGLINLEDPIPVHVSAFGPRGRRMIAERGHGWTNSVASPEGAEAAMADMKRAWADAGRDPADLHANASSGGAVLKKAGDWDADYVKAQAGPSAAILLHNLAEEREFGSISASPPPELSERLAAYMDVYRRYEPARARYLANHRHHLMAVRPEEAHLITGEFMRAATLSGTREELRDDIRALAAMGYRRFSVHVRAVLPEMVESWAEVIAAV